MWIYGHLNLNQETTAADTRFCSDANETASLWQHWTQDWLVLLPDPLCLSILQAQVQNSGGHSSVFVKGHLVAPWIHEENNPVNKDIFLILWAETLLLGAVVGSIHWLFLLSKVRNMRVGSESNGG